MALSGVSAKTLQYLMGHSDISITLNVYTHIKYDDAQKEVELVQTRQQKEMENVRKELEQVGEIQPKIIPFRSKAWWEKGRPAVKIAAGFFAVRIFT